MQDMQLFLPIPAQKNSRRKDNHIKSNPHRRNPKPIKSQHSKHQHRSDKLTVKAHVKDSGGLRDTLKHRDIDKYHHKTKKSKATNTQIMGCLVYDKRVIPQ